MLSDMFEEHRLRRYRSFKTKMMLQSITLIATLKFGSFKVAIKVMFFVTSSFYKDMKDHDKICKLYKTKQHVSYLVYNVRLRPMLRKIIYISLAMQIAKCHILLLVCSAI